LSVDSESVQQLGATELRPEQDHIQLHQARVSTVPLGLQLPSACPQGISIGQQAVDKVNPGPPHSVQQSVLQEIGELAGTEMVTVRAMREGKASTCIERIASLNRDQTFKT
jgi:hypothetical protein